MNSSRRQFIKKMAGAWAVAVASQTAFLGKIEAAELNQDILADKSVTWSKAPCRFCGTGCGVMVGVKAGRVVAVAGDRENPVNKGLLCVKGYHLPAILYGNDRLTHPLVKKNGKFKQVSWEEALGLIANTFTNLRNKFGNDAIGIYGSGQWAIQDGYAATKFFKGGLGTNNIEANARLCMASAVVGFLKTFGKDEPMGCYDDLEAADAFVMWGNNSAEMHPVLFSRITERKRKASWVKIIDISTRSTRTSKAADLLLNFKPQSDLAIANAICYCIIKWGKINKNFLSKHVAFKRGATTIGYGIEGKEGKPGSDELISFDEYNEFLKTYTPEYASKISGVSKNKIIELAKIYANPNTKVVSLWCMGVNQHTRGTWMNNLIYNIHLLTGKISQPGNGPFSLTGQPSACGTVREVGTLTHGLPGGRNVKNAEHRAFAEKIWGCPSGTIPSKPSMHTMAMFRKLKGGVLKALWIQVTNPMVTLPELPKFIDGIKKNKPFIVVSDVYPTPTTALADVILPSSMWVEREGCFGNSERRTQQWNKLVPSLGESKPDSWQIIEVAKRMGLGKLFPWKTEDEQAKGLYEEYRKFTVGVGKDIALYEDLKKARGLRWPVINGIETRWRYREGSDPYVNKGDKFSFYGNKKHENRAIIWIRPYEPAAEVPDQNFPFWLCTGRILEHWHTGSMTRRVKQLHQAAPETYVEINPHDAQKLGIFTGNKVKLTTPRGNMVLPAVVDGRASPQKGLVFVPFFDESKLINLLTLDAHCPLSKQPDYKKCAVKIEKI